MARIGCWSSFRTIIGLGLVGAILLIQSGAAEAEEQTATVLTMRSQNWRYLQVTHGTMGGFESPAFDAQLFQLGEAGFGTVGGKCSWNNTHDVANSWSPDTDLLLRKPLSLPPDATKVHITGTIDNDADVYVNGYLVQHVENGFCQSDGIDVTVPSGDLLSGNRNNLLAIRAIDHGDETYVDVKVTYEADPSKIDLKAGYGIAIREEGGSSTLREEGCTNGPAVTKQVDNNEVRFFLTAHHCIDGTGDNANLTFPEKFYLQSKSADGGYNGGQRGWPVSEAYPSCAPPVCIQPDGNSSNRDSRDVTAWRPNGSIVTNQIFAGQNNLHAVIGTKNVGGRGGLSESSQVCFFGATSRQERCGFIQRIFKVPFIGNQIFTQIPGLGSLTDHGTAYVKTCSLGGDSGSPVYTPADGLGRVRVVGVVVGSNTPGACTLNSVTQFLLFSTIQKELNVNILTK
jgi:hypothetical protein